MSFQFALEFFPTLASVNHFVKSGQVKELSRDRKKIQYIYIYIYIYFFFCEFYESDNKRI